MQQRKGQHRRWWIRRLAKPDRWIMRRRAELHGADRSVRQKRANANDCEGLPLRGWGVCALVLFAMR